MTLNIFLLKGDLNGENRSGAFLFLSGIVFAITFLSCISLAVIVLGKIINQNCSYFN